MSLAIVHLSDLHIRNEENPLLNRANSIAGAIASVSTETLEVLLAWTGDISFSGRSSEYDLASKLINGVEAALRQNPAVVFLGSVFIPGNHDCDFSQSGDARLPLIETLPGRIDSIDLSGDFVRQIVRPQEAFFSFLASRGINPTNALTWAVDFKAKGFDFQVRCCNSAWVSQLPEKPSILFPPHAISESRLQFTISLLHHPFTWFEPLNGKTIRRKLEVDSDLILSGHEHDPDNFHRVSSDSNTHYLEAGALAAPNVATGFSVSVVDMVETTLRTFDFIWSDPIYTRTRDFVSPFVRKQRAIVNRFVRSAEFERKLDEVTTPFSHPLKELRLQDIYVDPPLTEIIPSADGKSTEQSIPAEGVLEFLLSQKIVRVSASKGFGKSALARIVCKNCLDIHSLVPVFLDSERLSGYDDTRVTHSVEKEFSNQYGTHLLEHFRQLSKSSKVIVFDDWDRLRFNENGRKHLLASLTHHADYIFLFDDKAAFLQQIQDLTVEDESLRPTFCELRPFGYQLRGALIDRWQKIGRAFEVQEGELAHDISVSEHLLDGLIGRGVMPSTPLFILSALQMQREATRSGGDYGSYGHIYQSLITSRLSKQASKQTPLKLNFLSMLAFLMFENQSDVLDAMQIRETARAYEAEYSYDVEPDSLLREIAESGLIAYDGNNFRFEYRYVYYYSVAHAFRINVANERTRNGAREHLSRLASEAYFDDNANILIFYIYLSKDRVLMEEVLANAGKIFQNTTPCDLDSDLAFVNNLLKEPVPIDEPSIDLDHNVAEHRAALDKAASKESTIASSSPDTKAISEVDFAFRSLEIMGQVLKNFPTDLRGDLKLSLTKASYALSLRSIGSLLQTLQANREHFKDIMTRNLAKEGAFASKSLEKQEVVIDNLIIFFAQVGIYGLLKKVSNALGTEDLRHTYDQVKSDLGDAQIATLLIDLSIRLDHFSNVPESDIFSLERRLRGNATAWTILKMLVAQYMSMFPTHWKLRQKFLSTFKFSAVAGLPSPKQLLPNR